MRPAAPPACEGQGQDVTKTHTLRTGLGCGAPPRRPDGRLWRPNQRGTLWVPIIHPCWSGGMPILVEDAAEPVRLRTSRCARPVAAGRPGGDGAAVTARLTTCPDRGATGLSPRHRAPLD